MNAKSIYIIAVISALSMCLNGTAEKRKLARADLTKLFHNKSPQDGLEVGKISFYFTQQPEMIALPTKKSATKVERSYFFRANLADPAKRIVLDEKKLQDFVTVPNGLYELHVKAVKAGIKFTITYDPNKINFDDARDVEWFVTPDQQKGLGFKLINKQLHDLLQKDATLRRTASLDKKPKVVIDCGHGGDDAGTIGFFNISEKDITLDVGLKVAQLLRNSGCAVLLTREGDEAMALDERTTFANINKADLFVSIHANNASRNHASGIETFCLNDSLFKPHTSSSVGLQACAARHMSSLRNKSSYTLASNIHEQILAHVKKKYSAVNNRGVKYLASQVLFGTTMPSILVEIGFLSNEFEARMLADADYQYHIAQGICDGVLAYVKQCAA